MGTVRVQRWVFGVLAALFAVMGVVLLAAPGSTKRIFAWGLKPQPVAALTGGLFLGAAVAYAYGAARARIAGRGLCLLTIVLTVPTFGYTLINSNVFDFGRWQAIAWLVLFTVAPILAIVMLAWGGWPSVGSGGGLAAWARVVLLVVSVASAVAAVVLWVSPVGEGGWLPFIRSQFVGQLLGMWFAVIWFACLWAAFRPVEEARVFVTAAVAILGGALVGTLRTFGRLHHSGRVGYVLVLAVGLAVCAVVLTLGGARGTVSP